MSTDRSRRFRSAALPITLAFALTGNQLPAQEEGAVPTPTQRQPELIQPGASSDSDANAQDSDASAQDSLEEFIAAVGAKQPAKSDEIRFAFSGTPWREVIEWLAEEGELALHVDSVPTGSFTYSDPQAYTHQAAIDRVNLFLLPQGYSLVRSGHLLSVINLSDPRSMQQLDAIAPLVNLQDLETRASHDVVKCIFPLGELEAEEAVQELTALNLMTNPSVFSKTKQLMITDTVGKLRNAKVILDAFKPDEMDNGTVVESFVLEHVTAEDVLEVARPHLGLATGEMIGIDVSVSADVKGKNIFVTGVEDKVKLIERLVAAVDKPKKGSIAEQGDMVLKAHAVNNGSVETAYNVLVTLLADREIRLSMDEEAGTVVALAPPSVHAEIEKTVAELQGADAEFAVIPLETVDPYFAVTLLEEMLDLPDPLDDPEDIDPDAPKIDADPGNSRLFVRAKKAQIEQIKKIVEGLDDSSTAPRSSEEAFRILPLKGKQAEQILETAVRFWRGDNPVIVYRSSTEPESVMTERVVSDAFPNRTLTANNEPSGDLSNQRWLTSNSASTAPAIRCQVTPRGVLLQSDDRQALDAFETHVRVIAGPVDTSPSPPIVFYLKYTKADDALKMLAELLDGGDAAEEFEAGTLVNGYVSSGPSLLGSLITTRDGTMTLTSDTMTILADTRLNRLIAQGTSTDIERIEEYLKIVDKDNSITAIETYGTAHVINLVNSRATDVADAIRQAFAGRVTAGAQGVAGGQPGGQGQRGGGEAAALAAAKARGEGGDDDKKKKGNQPQPQARATRSLEPKITIAVHEPSNSLIVTAPEQLFKEVEALALSIDRRGEQQVEVVAPLNGELMEAVLQQILLQEAATSNRRESGSRTAANPAPRPQQPKGNR